MAFVVAAIWKAKEGEEKRVEETIVKMTPLSRAEEGNLFYQAQVNPEDPRTFFLYEQYVDEAAYELLRRYGVACVVADTAGRWPKVLEVTSDLVYVRLHGDRELYVSGYAPSALDEWAERCRAWVGAGLDVYVYFDNDVKGHAPHDALALLERVS